MELLKIVELAQLTSPPKDNSYHPGAGEGSQRQLFCDNVAGVCG
jgi:hypothetical protein